MSLRKLTDGEAGYIAGFIDGEGSLMLTRYQDDPPRFQIRVVIANTDLGALQCIRERIGGSIRMRRRQKPHHRDVCILTLNANATRNLIPQILDRLIVKKEQAHVLLRALEMTSHKRGHEVIALKAEMTRLNHRGLVL